MCFFLKTYEGLLGCLKSIPGVGPLLKFEMSKSVFKNNRLGPLLEVEMPKKCWLLWRKAFPSEER